MNPMKSVRLRIVQLATISVKGDYRKMHGKSRKPELRQISAAIGASLIGAVAARAVEPSAPQVALTLGVLGVALVILANHRR